MPVAEMLAKRPKAIILSGGPASVYAEGAGFVVTATSDGAPVAAFEDDSRRLYGVQFHPEVMHTSYGQRVLEQFLYEGAGCQPSWTMVNIVDEAVDAIRAQVGGKRVI